MSHFEETIDLEGSCSAKLSNFLNLPDRIEIPALQNSGHDLEYHNSNHTTPLNYMRRETPKAALLRDSMKTHGEQESNFSLEKNNRFSHLAPSSNQDSFFEFGNSSSESLEALEASNDVLSGTSRNPNSFGESKWQSEDYGLELSAEQVRVSSSNL